MKEELLDKFFDKLSEDDIKKLKKVDADILMSLDDKKIESFNSLDDYLDFKKNLKNESKPDKDKIKDAFSVSESLQVDEKMIDRRIERQKRKGEEAKARAEKHKEESDYYKQAAKHHEEQVHARSGGKKRASGFKGFLQTIGRSIVDEPNTKVVYDEQGNAKVVPDYDAIRRHEFERGMCGMCAAIEEEKDPKKKKEAQLKFDIMMQGVEFDDEGRPCGAQIDKELCRKHGIFPDDIRDDLASSKVQQKGRAFQLDYAGDFRKDFTQIADSYDSSKQELRKALEEKDLEAWHQQRSETLQKRKDNGTNLGARLEKFFKKEGSNSNSKEEPKEEVVKDKDGSEIHQRPKKNGEGNTYVRTKNGKEVGYASKEDFQKAQQRKNESQISELNNFIYESSLIDICDMF